MTDLATTITVLDACGSAGVPVLLVSDPGMGKSSLIRALAVSQGIPCETVLGSIREPADIAGLPLVTETGVVLSPPAWAQRLHAQGAGILFLDELTTCNPATQAALLSVALDRTVGDLTLPTGVRVIAGANPPDRAADGYDLAPPLSNRFCHVEVRPTVAEWIEGTTVSWANPPASRAITPDPARHQTVKALVTGYINAKPEHLHMFPTSPDATGKPWPSRRTWTMLIAALGRVREDDLAAVQALTFGLVGEGVGVEFTEWVANADLPDPVSVIADPGIVTWTDRPDRVWAILSGVVGWAASEATIVAWRDAWGPLLACATAGAFDVAASAARALNRARPTNAKPPAAVKTTFAPILREAGLTEQGAAA